MTVHVKLFPIAGICDKSQELELTLNDGKLSEALTSLQEQLGENLANEIEKLMFLHNGRALDRREDIDLIDGDRLWLLPMLSGG